MMSGYQSREFGLSLRGMLTADILVEINCRRRGQTYISTVNANIINGSEYKGEIVFDPLLRYFKCGMNKDGYWNSSNTKIQFEDAQDVLAVLFPKYGFTHLLDQSSGDMKHRENGLLVSNMNSSFGGAATIMRDTVVNEVGPVKGTLNIDDVQHMQISPHDSGPFWMNILEKLSTKHDKVIGAIEKGINQDQTPNSTILSWCQHN